MSNKCNEACQSFAKTIKNMVMGLALGTFTTLSHTNDLNENQPIHRQDGQTFLENAQPKHNEVYFRKPEKPCAPSPVLKMTLQGAITKMEIPPDCPGKYIETKNKV